MSTVSTAVASAWRVDPTHSSVEFAVRHLMISTVKGRFADVSGTLIGDETDLGNASIDLTIPVAGIDTHEGQRDAHLRSADFFDSEHHPAITFRSTNIVRASSDSFTVTGDLTIRGVSKPDHADRPRGRPGARSMGRRARRLQRDHAHQPEGFRAELESGARDRRCARR